MVVNEAFAAAYLGPNPVGLHMPLKVADRTGWDVVGIVSDTRYSASVPAEPEFFVSYRQAPGSIAFEPMLVMRTTDDPSLHLSEVRAEIGTNAELVPDSIMTMRERLRAALAGPRTYSVLVAASGIAALAIAVLGLFGILSYTIEQRGHELGIRAALGATPRALMWLVVRPVTASVAAGVALGAAFAYVFNGTLTKVVYGVRTDDFVNFVTAFVAIAVATLAISFVPARRLVQLDPLRALKQH
jgi:putative ABC transport system permease protein